MNTYIMACTPIVEGLGGVWKLYRYEKDDL